MVGRSVTADRSKTQVPHFCGAKTRNPTLKRRKQKGSSRRGCLKPRRRISRDQSRSFFASLRSRQDLAAIEESTRIEDIGHPRPLTAVSLRDLAPHVAVVPLALRFARRFFRVGVTYTFAFLSQKIQASWRLSERFDPSFVTFLT